jgi:hypothetical protein
MNKTDMVTIPLPTAAGASAAETSTATKPAAKSAATTAATAKATAAPPATPAATGVKQRTKQEQVEPPTAAPTPTTAASSRERNHQYENEKNDDHRAARTGNAPCPGRNSGSFRRFAIGIALIIPSILNSRFWASFATYAEWCRNSLAIAHS